MDLGEVSAGEAYKGAPWSKGTRGNKGAPVDKGAPWNDGVCRHMVSCGATKQPCRHCLASYLMGFIPIQAAGLVPSNCMPRSKQAGCTVRLAIVNLLAHIQAEASESGAAARRNLQRLGLASSQTVWCLCQLVVSDNCYHVAGVLGTRTIYQVHNHLAAGWRSLLVWEQTTWSFDYFLTSGPWWVYTFIIAFDRFPDGHHHCPEFIIALMIIVIALMVIALIALMVIALMIIIIALMVIIIALSSSLP